MAKEEKNQNWQQKEPANSTPLTQEERERFMSIWGRKMPQVLTWSDEEIRYGMFVGM
jgi:hypothetical protein